MTADRRHRRDRRRSCCAPGRCPMPDGDADKEERGRVLVIAGSARDAGRACSLATAALRAGAGKLAVATGAQRRAAVWRSRMPEARVIALAGDRGRRHRGRRPWPARRALADRSTPCWSAPAAGRGRRRCAFTPPLLAAATARAASCSTPARWTSSLDVAAASSRPPLLTPHAGEMAHLTGADQGRGRAPTRSAHAREAARRWNAVVALKGATTFIAAPDGDCWRHVGGNAGPRHLGLGRRARRHHRRPGGTRRAAGAGGGWGVALHARAGRALAERLGPLGYLARELPAEIPGRCWTSSLTDAEIDDEKRPGNLLAASATSRSRASPRAARGVEGRFERS